MRHSLESQFGASHGKHQKPKALLEADYALWELSIRKNREKWLKVFYILGVEIMNFQQEMNFLHWPHSEFYFFPFKSPIYIFFVHGAVLHEEFFIRVYDVYWAYPQCPLILYHPPCVPAYLLIPYAASLLPTLWMFLTFASLCRSVFETWDMGTQ